MLLFISSNFTVLSVLLCYLNKVDIAVYFHEYIIFMNSILVIGLSPQKQ